MRKNSLRLGILGLAAIVPLATIVSCGSTSNDDSLAKTKYLGQGSSSVLPIIDALKDHFTNLQYEPTGSGDGLKVGLALGGDATGIKDKDFGMTSSSKNPATGQKWDNVRTVTWAIDAIGIMVNLPEGTKTLNNAAPIVDIEELAKLYDAEKDTTTSWDHLVTNLDTSTAIPTSSPKALGRTGGKSASGTADGFWHTLGKHLPTGSTKDEDHKHLADNGGQLTAEANSVALSSLKNADGSITYLSLGYALKNSEMGKAEVADIKVGTSTWNAQKIENVKDGSYQWTRPFNIIFKAEETSNAGQDFALELLSPTIQKIIESKNFVGLTNAQLDKQFGSHDADAIKLDLRKPDSTKVSNVYTDVLGLEIPATTK